MSRSVVPESGSLDMLLDTMCNTFGGVCFIALLVAILSAMMPKKAAEESDNPPDVERMVENERLAAIVRRRDELKAALDIQEDLFRESETNVAEIVTEGELVAGLSAKDAAVSALEAELKEMEDEIVRLATSTDYNKTESERLRKLADSLRKELEKAEYDRRRTVRTPLERELDGITPVDYWIRQEQIYIVRDASQCHCENSVYGEDVTADYTVIQGRGAHVDTTYFASTGFENAVRKIGGMQFARIFCDSSSFNALCLFRDELVKRGLRYNWYVFDGETLRFVYGKDSKVQ